jgi:hypothetical protein
VKYVSDASLVFSDGDIAKRAVKAFKDLAKSCGATDSGPY